MLDWLSNNQDISEFLGNFPQIYQNQVLEYTVLHGIKSIKRKYSDGISFEKLRNSVMPRNKGANPQIKEKIISMKEELNKLNKEVSFLNGQRSQTPDAIKRHASEQTFRPFKSPEGFNTERESHFIEKRRVKQNNPNRKRKHHHHSRQSHSHHKSQPNQNFIPTKRVVPKYLKNIRSKIRSDVLKDIAKFRSESVMSRDELLKDDKKDKHKEVRNEEYRDSSSPSLHSLKLENAIRYSNPYTDRHSDPNRPSYSSNNSWILPESSSYRNETPLSRTLTLNTTTIQKVK